MSLQFPQLTQDEEEERLKNIQRGSIFPILFTYYGNGGTVLGNFQYVTQQYKAVNFSAVVGLKAFALNCQDGPAIVQISYAPTPFLGDSLTPIDSGNVIDQVSQNPGVNVDTLNERYYSPGDYPLFTNQLLYIHFLFYQVASNASSYALFLMVQQSGLII